MWRINRHNQPQPRLPLFPPPISRYEVCTDTCNICLDTVKVQGQLSHCSHLFCFRCIKQWAEVWTMQTENTCPMCKERFQKITKVTRSTHYAGKKPPVVVSLERQGGRDGRSAVVVGDEEEVKEVDVVDLEMTIHARKWRR